MTTDTDTSTTESTEMTDDDAESYTIHCEHCEVDVRATVESSGPLSSFVFVLACPCARITLDDDRLTHRDGRDEIEAALPDPWTINDEDSGLAAARTAGFPSPVFQL